MYMLLFLLFICHTIGGYIFHEYMLKKYFISLDNNISSFTLGNIRMILFVIASGPVLWYYMLIGDAEIDFSKWRDGQWF